MTSRLPLAALAILVGTAAEACGQTPPTVDEYIAAVEGVQDTAGDEGLGSMTLPQLMDHLGVPGVSVAVIRDFEVQWAKGYGVADVETGAPVDTETLFQAASISKPVAAMGVLAAVRDGLFELDDDIDDLLVSWALDGAGFTSERPVTPRALTSHTSGLGDGFGFPGYEPGRPLPSVVQILRGEGPSNVGPVVMERPPMAFMEYSGGGVTVMQLALTDVRGEAFDVIVQRDVLDPVGMTRSTFRQPLPPELDANAARGHDRSGQARGVKWHVYPELAAAGLWTTPTDLARFAIEVQRAAAGHSDRVLPRHLAREMLTPVGVGPYAVGFAVGQRGEGWYFSHGGSNWGFRATLLAHHVKGYGLVVMTNADRGSELAAEVSARIQRAYRWDSVADPVPRGS